MDRTGRIRHTRDRRVVERNRRAWEKFALDGDCPYCGHEYETHALAVGQPHFFRLATPAELVDRSVRLYLPSVDDGSRYRRVVVGEYAEVKSACCLTCAGEMKTEQATCYQAKVAIGEIVGKAVDRGID